MARVWIEDRANHAEYQAAMEKWKAAKKAGSRRQAPGRWRVRWYGPDAKPKSATFAKLPEAENHVHEVEAKMRDGSYRDASAGKATLTDVYEKWKGTLGGLEPTTRETYLDTWRVHVEPRWGDYQVRRIEWEDIAEWVGHLAEGSHGCRKVGPGRTQKVHLVLSLVLGHAVRAKRIAVNPAAGVPLPRPVPQDHVYLTHAQVDRLAEAAGEYRLLLLLLAYTGLRWGEVSAVTVGAVDTTARRLAVRQAYKKTRDGLILGLPKTHERRKVPILRSLALELEKVTKDRDAGDLLFTAPAGGPLYGDNFRTRVFNPAVKTAGLANKGVTPHKLRHTAASLGIASGADVKVVQTMLGHKSAAMTLDTYGHLFPDRLDEVADRLDRERGRRDALRDVATIVTRYAAAKEDH
ncbi:site-specific integrase [Streptomyces sp. NBC_00554]|uniref:tyrosine-type recombinase/integrase n=1 Tax=Streptomyces sp. NBC_00554 TaxID=2903661 RepID=UPI00352D7B98|nr:site-specific integrase [Streptomyces sp. NBC_00554]